MMVNNMEKVKGLSLIITVVDRKKGKKVIKLFNKLGCTYHHIFMGSGTAPSEIYEYLGVGVIEKDVVVSVTESIYKDQLLITLIKKLKFDKPGQGVAWSIPLDGIDSLSSLKAVLGKEA